MDEIKLIELNYLGMLEVSGEGSFDLLQGQITCDLNKINSSSSSLGALCNSKGRVLSSFIVSSSEVTRFILIGPSKMMEKTEEELNKYSPFYQVKIKRNTSSLFYGIKKELYKKLYGKAFLAEGNTLKINDISFISYLNKDYLLAICKSSSMVPDQILNLEFEENPDKWFIDELQNLNVEITEDNSGKYTPHDLNYDLTKRVDFDKGCYTGQEVVARMQYRAKNLPSLKLAESTNTQLKTNMIVCNEKDIKIGSLVKTLNLSTKSICLISTKDKTDNSILKVRETDSDLVLI